MIAQLGKPTFRNSQAYQGATWFVRGSMFPGWNVRQKSSPFDLFPSLKIYRIWLYLWIRSSQWIVPPKRCSYGSILRIPKNIFHQKPVIGTITESLLPQESNVCDKIKSLPSDSHCYQMRVVDTIRVCGYHKRLFCTIRESLVIGDIRIS